MHTYELSTPLAGAPSRAWRVLTDVAGFAAWNTIIPSARGEMSQGARLDLRIRGPRGILLPFRPVVLELTPPTRAVLEGIVGGRRLLRMVHTFEIVEGPDGQRLRQHWTASGAIPSVLWPVLRAQMARFARLGEDLSRWLEAGARA